MNDIGSYSKICAVYKAVLSYSSQWAAMSGWKYRHQMVRIRAEDCRGQSQGMGLGFKVTYVSWARRASLGSEAVDDDQVLVKVTCVFIHNGPVQSKDVYMNT